MVKMSVRNKNSGLIWIFAILKNEVYSFIANDQPILRDLHPF